MNSYDFLYNMPRSAGASLRYNKVHSSQSFANYAGFCVVSSRVFAYNLVNCNFPLRAQKPILKWTLIVIST